MTCKSYLSHYIGEEDHESWNLGKKIVPVDIGLLASSHLGERLRRIRKLAGLTQSELADRLHIGQTALSRLEKRADVMVSTLRQYLGALGAGIRVEAVLDPAIGDRGFPKIPRGLSSVQGGQLSLPILGEPAMFERRDVVLSIKPEYSGKIVKGEKTVELRRRFPLGVAPGTLALIYETSPTQAITSVVEIADVLKGPPGVIWNEFSDQACIGKSEFDSYFAGAKNGFVIKLRGARRLSRTLELRELRDRFNFEPPQSFLYAPPELQEALTLECSKILN
jgi:predicted transcriptional regulator